MEVRMSPTIRIAALAIAATLAVAACDDGDGAAVTPASDLVTPASDLTPSADASALAELSARVDELETKLGDDAQARLGDAEARLDDAESRLGDVDPIDLQSRLSELEDEIRLLSVAVEQLQAPTNLGGQSPDATD
jgi:hypothetical protein